MSQRKNYFVEKGMQSKFILTLLLLLFLVAVITICNLFVIYEFVVQNMDPIHGATAQNLMEVIKSVAGYRLLLIGLVNLMIVAIIGVFYSHQFAGPSYKLERSIRQIATGDLSFDVTLRKSDAMHNIADSLNVMLSRFRELFVKANELTGRLRNNVDGLAAEHENLGKETAVLRGTIAELEDILGSMKLKPTPGAEGEGEAAKEDAAREAAPQ